MEDYKMDINNADEYFIHTYNRSTVFTKGEDVYLFDDKGNKYLDMGAGIAVSALGYSNEEYKKQWNESVNNYKNPCIKSLLH